MPADVAAAVATYKAELVAMQSLLAQQRSILNTEQLTKLMNTQAVVFTGRAANLKGISTESVSDLTTIIQSGAWSQDHQSGLVMALANAMSSVAGGNANGDDRRKPQSLSHFHNYLTEDEGRKFMDPAVSLTVKIELALDVCDRIHAILLREISKRHILATLCAWHTSTEGWNVKSLRSWYLYFKKVYAARFKGRSTDADVGFILQYPEDPSKLPVTTFTAITGGKPLKLLEINASDVVKIELCICCRGNATSLRDDDIVVPGRSLAMVPVRHGAKAQPQPQFANPMQADMNMNQMFQLMSTCLMQVMQSSGGSASSSAGEIEIVQPPQKKVRANAEAPEPQTPKAAAGVPALEDTVTPPPEPAGGKAAGAIVPVTTPDRPTPQQQADRFLASLAGEDPPAEDDDDDEAGEDGDAIVMARPAAAPNTLAKAKPKAKGKAKAKAAGMPAGKKPIDGWPWATRMAQYPTGCAKCRHSPGCTRSCFVERGQL